MLKLKVRYLFIQKWAMFVGTWVPLQLRCATFYSCRESLGSQRVPKKIKQNLRIYSSIFFKLKLKLGALLTLKILMGNTFWQYSPRSPLQSLPRVKITLQWFAFSVSELFAYRPVKWKGWLYFSLKCLVWTERTQRRHLTQNSYREGN